MSNTVKVYVEEPNTTRLVYPSVRLYRDTTPNGAFSTLVATLTLADDDYEYEYEDASGSAGNWYRYSFYNSSGPVETEKGPAFQVGAITLAFLRIEAAIEAGLGFRSTADTGSTSTTLRDATLADNGIDSTFLGGGYIYRPDASDPGDLLRRLGEAPFDGSDDLTVTRAWANAPTNGEVYHFFALASPIDWPGVDVCWDRAIREALEGVWFVDQINLGPGTTTGKFRFSLGSHVGYVTEDQVRRVFSRRTDSTTGFYRDYDYDENLRWWTSHHNGPGSLDIEVGPPPATDEDMWIEVARTYEPLHTDDDVTTGPLRLAMAASVYALYRALNRSRKGRFRGEEADWKSAFYRERARYQPKFVIKGL